MTLPPDKLFQQRLENYSKNPPARAWERIETGLNKKKSNPGWMKVAASFLVIIVAAAMIYYKSQNNIDVASTNDDATQPLQENNIIPTSEEESVSTIKNQDFAPTTHSEVIQSQNNAERTSKDFKDDIIPVETINIKPDEDLTMRQTKEVVADSENSEMIMEESNSTTVPQSTESTQIDIAVNEKKPVGRKLMYSASDVHARFLKEKQSITLSPNEKPETGLEKIFDLTYSLKNGETSLGHLRRLKNDFISNAFDNQKSEKQ